MFISVVIATCNRSANLKQALESLLAQETDGTFRFEIILADNNSTDQTRQVADGFAPRFKGGFTYVFEPRRGKVHAVNKGIGHAKGEIIAFTDDDTIMDKHWLLAMKQCFELEKCSGIGGRILPAYPKGAPSWIRENVELLRGPIVYYDYGEGIIRYKKPMIEFLGANMAFRKEAFEEFGLFNPELGPGKAKLGEDTEFVKRLVRADKPLFYCGTALVWHPVDKNRMSLRYIAQWNLELGKYRFLIDEKGVIEDSLKCMFGIPCYIIRQILTDGGRLIFYAFNRGEFLKVWIRLFINLGRALEIKRHGPAKAKQESR